MPDCGEGLCPPRTKGSRKGGSLAAQLETQNREGDEVTTRRKTKNLQEEIVSNMRRWQDVEEASVASTTRIMRKADNPVLRLIMEIIKRDSQMHHKARESLAALKGKKMLIQEYLLNYLAEDERKHNRLLATLKKIKGGMYPYG
jgi:hypothetical protein